MLVNIKEQFLYKQFIARISFLFNKNHYFWYKHFIEYDKIRYSRFS